MKNKQESLAHFFNIGQVGIVSDIIRRDTNHLNNKHDNRKDGFLMIKGKKFL
jgi:hypothetical protein